MKTMNALIIICIMLLTLAIADVFALNEPDSHACYTQPEEIIVTPDYILPILRVIKPK